MAEELMVSVVVPTFNERENVGILCERVDAALAGVKHEIIFVDDSRDDTPEVIRRLGGRDESEGVGLQTEKAAGRLDAGIEIAGKSDTYTESTGKSGTDTESTGKTDTEIGSCAHIRLRHRENGSGLATAVIEGFGMAQGKYIVVMDADLQHPPEILRPMYAAITAEGCDFCIPSRFIPGGSDGGLNLYRKFVSATARYIGKAMLSSIRKVSDPTGGLFMFRRECIDGADLRPIGWKILIEVLAMAKYDSICEIPYTFCEREHGESKLSAKVTKEYLQQVRMLRKREIKRGNVRVVRVSPKRLAELAAEGKQDENRVMK